MWNPERTTACVRSPHRSEVGLHFFLALDFAADFLAFTGDFLAAFFVALGIVFTFRNERRALPLYAALRRMQSS